MKIRKVFSRICRKFIFLFDGLNTKCYMKMYNNWLKKNGLHIEGNARYIHHSVFLDGQGYQLIKIGNDTVISLGVTVLVHDFSIEAGFRALGNSNGDNEAHTMKAVVIDENCFVGANVTILGGTCLGKNCIVAAGSVLPGKKYPANSIIAGNPGKVIGNTLEWAQAKKDIGDYENGYFN